MMTKYNNIINLTKASFKTKKARNYSIHHFHQRTSKREEDMLYIKKWSKNRRSRRNYATLSCKIGKVQFDEAENFSTKPMGYETTHTNSTNYSNNF
jgi:hypothetical protein